MRNIWDADVSISSPFNLTDVYSIKTRCHTWFFLHMRKLAAFHFTHSLCFKRSVTLLVFKNASFGLNTPSFIRSFRALICQDPKRQTAPSVSLVCRTACWDTWWPVILIAACPSFEAAIATAPHSTRARWIILHNTFNITAQRPHLSKHNLSVVFFS